MFQSKENFSEKKCVPCDFGTPVLKGEALANAFKQINSHWMLIKEHHIEREYNFKNFKEGLQFVNKIGELAEAEKHHPEIFLSWNKVKIWLWTHKINGLSENDFIFASKADHLYQKYLEAK